MNTRLVGVFAVLVGLLCAHLVSADSGNIQLSVYGTSNPWWFAIEPLNDSGETVKVEYQETTTSTWVEAAANPGWGFFSAQSARGNGFLLPIAFRLTSSSGQQVTTGAIMTSITPGAVLNSGVQFGSSAPAPSTPAPSTPAPTRPPTAAPTHAPTPAPTHAPTSAPTHAPTPAPTHAPTPAPTHAPTPAPTPEPTQAPTLAPTRAPTPAPTRAPTQAPTQAPTPAPTQAPTPAPTRAPTQAATQAPTQAPSSVDLCAVPPTSVEPLKVLVPLYVAPGSEWTQIIDASQSTGVQFLTIINPNSGPSASGPDSSYSNFMQQFSTANIKMIGYVHSSFGARAIADVMADIDTYANSYSFLEGIFIDEASGSASEVSYYTQLCQHVTSKSGYTNCILNPGSQPEQAYLDIATNNVIFEDSGSNFVDNFSSFVKCAPTAAAKAGYKYKFSAIAHDVSASSVTSLLTNMMNAGIGYVYLTDGAEGCCTYNNIASYIAQEATDVEDLN